MNGRDSRDGRLPAGETAMSGVTLAKTTPTRDKPNDERVRTTVCARACVCLCTAARLCLFVSVRVLVWRGEMRLALKQCRRPGQIMSGNPCVHVSA